MRYFCRFSKKEKEKSPKLLVEKINFQFFFVWLKIKITVEQYKKNYKQNKNIKKLEENDAPPEEMKNLQDQ